jgi:glutamate-1-semialdehyde aminotransferase
MGEIFSQQLHAVSEMIATQLDTLRQATTKFSRSDVTASPSPKPETRPVASGVVLPPATEPSAKSSSVKNELFVPYKRIRAGEDSLADQRQRQHVAELAEKFSAVTAESKKLTQRYRAVFANNRNIAGFRPAWKEMVYQIVADSAEGSRIREAGGREFIDLTMGFGVHLFGHKPSFIQKAIIEAASEGMPLGPISHRAGPAAERFCRMTGMERVAFYNTGSEAVMTALRIARTATGRSRIALFEGAYHGTFDGVLALRREENNMLYSAPGSPGTPSGMVEDVMVLRYDDPQSLELVRRHGQELAAVLVEPVQSRRPDLRPQKFLQDLRTLTRESGSALIFDEMVSGFRCHPGGAQAYFDVRADLAAYGKIIGGGMPIGLVAGRAEFMDAVDGGHWSFGDDSYPRKRNTFVAGTFCHHPLSLAAMIAVLNKLEESGPGLQEELNQRTEALSRRLNNYFMENDVPIRVAHFSSLFRFFLRGDLELLFYHLIQRGIYVWEGRHCFL